MPAPAPVRAAAPAKPDKFTQALQKWADGKATLKDVRGYSDDELYTVARTAYLFFRQGKVKEARTIFQGLYAVNPLDPYFATALGVVELAAGNHEGAAQAYDVAIKLSPAEPGGYAGRAEVRLAQNQKNLALDDLRKAASLCPAEHELKDKISAMLAAVARR